MQRNILQDRTDHISILNDRVDRNIAIMISVVDSLNFLVKQSARFGRMSFRQVIHIVGNISRSFNNVKQGKLG
ncbi:MAG: hypothetical protein U5K69_07970 [Balneolaceae bacterium]|nr:hypothetical protein [Balneolaceae bacterium]